MRKFRIGFLAVVLTVALFAFQVNASEAVPKASAGEKTLKNLLLTAFQPIGGTLYVWGG